MDQPPSTLSTRRVLLVDDEEVVLHSLAKLLVLYGCEVTTAASGEEAVELFSENADRIDIAVIDQRMPGIGGTETGKQLRDKHSELPIIFISGYCDFSDDSDDEQPIIDEKTGTMDKPLLASNLLKEIERVTTADRK